MDVLWRDRDPSSAANNLHQAVHVARRALAPEAIVVRDEALFLVADIDVDRLEAAAAEARRTGTPAAYRAALAIYAGELLPENRYDEWAEDRRDELAELAAELEEELSGLGAGDAPHGLPADASSFVGRERELAELRALLGRTRLLTLTGTGGAGKTRLALELARGAAAAFADGAALVPLAPLADARLVPDAVAAALDIRALSGQDIGEALVDVLASRTLLLVLDNCEHLLGASADAGRHVAPLGTRPDRARDEPRAAPHPGRGRVPRSLARHSRSRSAARSRRLAPLRGRAAVRRAGGRGRARLRARRRERTGCGPHLLPARRPSARARARRRPARSARPACRSRATGRSLQPAPLREPGCPDPAADARGDPPVEPRSARARRAGALPSPRGLRGRVRAGGGRTRVHGRRPRLRGRSRSARPTRREVARRSGRGWAGAALSPARDGSPLCARPADRVRRDLRARGEARVLGARARRAGAAIRHDSIARPRTSASRTTRSSLSSRAMRSASAPPSGRSGCEGSISRRRSGDSRRLSRRLPSGRVYGRTHCSRRRRSTSAPAPSRER